MLRKCVKLKRGIETGKRQRREKRVLLLFAAAKPIPLFPGEVSRFPSEIPIARKSEENLGAPIDHPRSGTGLVPGGDVRDPGIVHRSNVRGKETEEERAEKAKRRSECKGGR